MSNNLSDEYIVYVHTNLINNKKYVGQTKHTLKERSGVDGKNYKPCTLFYKAIEKFGWNNFSHEILEKGLSSVEADELEKYYIKYYHTYIEDPLCWGYNLTPGGKEAPLMTEETRKRISQIIKDKWGKR